MPWVSAVLPGAQRPDQDDEVARARSTLGEGPAQRVGVLRRRQDVLAPHASAPRRRRPVQVGEQRRPRGAVRAEPDRGRRVVGGPHGRARPTSCGRAAHLRRAPCAGPRNHFAADRPSATTTGGSSSSSWRRSQPLQRATSGAFGVRLPGGRHFTMLRTAASGRGPARPRRAAGRAARRTGRRTAGRSRPPSRPGASPTSANQRPAGDGDVADDDVLPGRGQLGAGDAGPGGRGQRRPVGRRGGDAGHLVGGGVEPGRSGGGHPRTLTGGPSGPSAVRRRVGPSRAADPVRPKGRRP